ncbi:MAG: aldose 1-epimerase [Thermoflexales bacterium]
MTELPECPAPGWAGSALIRLADPQGAALAWIAPEAGANCLAFAVMRAGGWVNLLFSAGPDALRSRPTRFGIPLLAPFPGLLPGGRYTWRGAEYRLAPNAADGHSFAHGFAHDRPWRIVRRTASDVELTVSLPAALSAAERAGYPFEIDLWARFSLEAGTLRIEFGAVNRGRDPAPLGLGLHPYFPVTSLAEHREALMVELPGFSEAVPMPPQGRALLEICPNVGDAHVARLGVARGDPAIELGVTAGARALAIYAPADQPSASIEPTTCALSAMARGEGGPDGMPALAPGGRLALRVTLRWAQG